MATERLDLRNPIFHNDDAARERLESLLWPQRPVCPRCGVTGERITKLQGKSTRPGVYKCKDCRKRFAVTVGTYRGGLAYPAIEMGSCAANYGVQQEADFLRCSCNGCSEATYEQLGSCFIGSARLQTISTAPARSAVPTR
jgi:transposase-like protein